MCYFKVYDSKEIQKYGHSELASWFQGNTHGGAAIQVTGVSWVYCWYFLPYLCLSLSLSPLAPSCLFPLHLMRIVSKYAHASIVTEWSDRNKVITSHLSERYLLIFCVTESNDI